MKRTTWVFIFVILIAALMFSSPLTWHTDAAAQSTNQVGETETMRFNVTTSDEGRQLVRVSLSGVPNGLSGYDFELRTENPESTEISGVEYPDSFGISNTTFEDNNSTITFRAADLTDNIQPGATNVTLAFFELTDSGTTQPALSIIGVNIDNDQGYDIPVRVDPETVVVDNTSEIAQEQTQQPATESTSGLEVTTSLATSSIDDTNGQQRDINNESSLTRGIVPTANDRTHTETSEQNSSNGNTSQDTTGFAYWWVIGLTALFLLLAALYYAMKMR